MKSGLHYNFVLIRVGLAFVFLYAAIAALMTPASWIGFLPTWFDTIINPETLLFVFSLFEILLAVLILFWSSPYPGGVATLLFIGMILPNTGAMEIVFRDVGLMFMALTLFFYEYHRALLKKHHKSVVLEDEA